MITYVLCKVEESFYRQKRTSDGDTINILSDGKMTVVTFLGSSGRLEECTIIPDNATIARQLFKEAISSTKNENVKYQMLETDVRKLGRKCRKYIRDTRRKKESQRSETEANLLRRLSLDNTLPGTKWCTRQTRPKYLKDLGDRKKLDSCCRDFHTSSDVIPPFSERHHYFNVFPWPITSCESAKKFRKCLEDEGSESSLEFAKLMFDVVRLPCFKILEREICEEYETWFNECKTKKMQRVAVEE
ncbi:group 3 secretory phospholipase A2-like [Stegodyphus dumicola]|uniref:group 3 secretory phospholipase A2-like n=1 Tax=Stegodyphus dumicola TaxID=202533 RepID=UPI0015A8CE3B|nr:group 3 secretory phospholipase A2-like [Stegodyphus dumicola]